MRFRRSAGCASGGLLLAGLDVVAGRAGGDESAAVDGLGAGASGGCDAVGVVCFGCGAGAAWVLELAAVAGVVEALLAGVAASAC
ncbi:hypothetical protein [Mycolicibacterium mageritense]|uniref:Uncharacterized protein n=1 Tax=Mycolicibacterium mageritense TaxID=53462 RepID=A0AAI8U356_MYCME|nr:hypothetical protein [Mycolicibacterium mageritense]BDY33171.1 hypothetical protein hbim_07146 [Mycolicibacterium mageritense]